eukprot:scaffold42618_cov18-Tisochrysis_lutea.AAC.2
MPYAKTRPPCTELHTLSHWRCTSHARTRFNHTYTPVGGPEGGIAIVGGPVGIGAEPGCRRLPRKAAKPGCCSRGLAAAAGPAGSTCGAAWRCCCATMSAGAHRGACVRVCVCARVCVCLRLRAVEHWYNI